MKSGFRGLIAAAALVLAAGSAHAADALKIGVLTDMSGPYADVVGTGTVAAVKLAVEDMGGKVRGMPIEVVSADTQNKPDVASALARQWLDQGVDVLLGGSSSAAGLAIQAVAKEKKHIFLITDSASSDFTGKQCSPYGIHFGYDTYALSNGTAKAIVKQGGKTWYFLTVDYAFGYALERDASRFVEAAGGKVLGSVRHPLGASDFSSYLLQAQASKAQVIGLANASTDEVNAIKAANEFGITAGGQRLAALLIFITDVESLGLKTAHGLDLTTSFYWDLNDKTRAWTKRFVKAHGKIPTMTQAAAYSAVLHYLQAVKASGTKDPTKVAATMKATPINDMYNTNVKIRPDGRVLNTMYLMEVKAPAESKYPHDDYKVLAKLPGDQAFRPMSEGSCPFVEKK